MTNKSSLEQYNKMRKEYLKGKITKEQWNDFCQKCLDEILKEIENNA